LKILEGDFAGSSASVIKAVGRGPMLRIHTGMMSNKSFRIPSEFTKLKLLNKDESRSAGQFLIIIILAFTLIGIPIAILLALFWKNVDFSIGLHTESGEKFVAQGNASEWKVLKKFVGVGALDSF
jgi:hypothetical protein